MKERPSRKTKKENVYSRLSRHRKKEPCLSILFHSDFNGLLRAEVERASLDANFMNSSYNKTFDSQYHENHQHNNSNNKIINYKIHQSSTNSVRPLFPVRIEPFIQIKVS